MRDPFLCSDCQKLGYCRKYNTKKLERTFDESEQAFFEKINKRKKIYKDEDLAEQIKLTSLENIRALYKSHTYNLAPNSPMFSNLKPLFQTKSLNKLFVKYNQKNVPKYLNKLLTTPD